MHIEEDSENKEGHYKTGCKSGQEAFHGSALILSPVSVVLSGESAEALVLALLHQDELPCRVRRRLRKLFMISYAIDILCY